MQNRSDDHAREPYEAPELTRLASVEDATLSTPETTGADAMSQLSASMEETPTQ
jgi:hypothetical protein